MEAEGFDAFAGEYVDILEANLSLAGESAAAFTDRRLAYIRRTIPLLPRRLLDFGCGTGRELPALAEAFPDAEIVGVDVSKEAIRVARRNVDDRRVKVFDTTEFAASEEADFDMVYSSGVFHHIPPPERPAALTLVKSTLRRGGVLVVSEHNPWHPGTRYLVRACPFDVGVELIRPRRFARQVTEAGLELVRLDYVSFFPGPLKFASALEPWLRRVPAGGQYVVVARRSD